MPYSGYNYFKGQIKINVLELVFTDKHLPPTFISIPMNLISHACCRKAAIFAKTFVTVIPKKFI